MGRGAAYRVDPYRPGAAYAIDVVLVLAAILVALVADRGWSWSLLAWGAAVGPIWVAATIASTAHGLRRVAVRTGATDEEVSAAAARVRARYGKLYPSFAISGVPIGIVAAGTRSPWPDALLTIYAALAVVIPMAMLTRLGRPPASRSGSEDGGS